jgi:hypothetical protein
MLFLEQQVKFFQSVKIGAVARPVIFQGLQKPDQDNPAFMFNHITHESILFPAL